MTHHSKRDAYAGRLLKTATEPFKEPIQGIVSDLLHREKWARKYEEKFVTELVTEARDSVRQQPDFQQARAEVEKAFNDFARLRSEATVLVLLGNVEVTRGVLRIGPARISRITDGTVRSAKR